MHNELGSWVTPPCHIHLGGALKMIIIKRNHTVFPQRIIRKDALFQEDIALVKKGL